MHVDKAYTKRNNQGSDKQVLKLGDEYFMDTVKLGEVATVNENRCLVNELLQVKGETPIIGCSDTIKGFTGAAPTARNATIIWGVGRSAGSVRYYKEPIITSMHVLVVKPKTKELLPHYLYFLIKREEEVLKRMSIGSVALYDLNLESVRGLEITNHFPSLEVQEKLVRCYELHKYFIALLSKQQEQMKQLMKYLVNEKV